MIRLGVNIDHVATLRNARGTSYPDPVHAAALAELGGADNITCHLREDRRHIRDSDVERLRKAINIPLNLEIAATPEMLAFALQIKPAAVTLVPEKRQELTTEGGLDLAPELERLRPEIVRFKNAGILVSLFIEAEKNAVRLSKEAGADAVEIHTGHFCLATDEKHRTRDKLACLEVLNDAAGYAHQLGLQVHVGHGLHYNNAMWMQLVPHCEEANIGHAIVARATLVGMQEAVREMRDLLNNSHLQPKF